VRVRVRRLGGIAGVTLRADLDTAELPGGSAPEVDRALAGLDWERGSGPPHPDAFRYELTRLDDPQRPSVVLNEDEVPPKLSPLIDAANAAGEIERRRPEGGG
jgi:hypothetical protein